MHFSPLLPNSTQIPQRFIRLQAANWIFPQIS
jgi:hypothetical protein